jgi:hypothetical protein
MSLGPFGSTIDRVVIGVTTGYDATDLFFFALYVAISYQRLTNLIFQCDATKAAIIY